MSALQEYRCKMLFTNHFQTDDEDFDPLRKRKKKRSSDKPKKARIEKKKKKSSQKVSFNI